MSLSASHLAYETELDLLERALNAVRGLRIPFPTEREAQTYRHRLHKARECDRARNREIFDPGTDLYGRSPYDALVCRIKPRGPDFYIYIERSFLPTTVEEIPDEDPAPLPLDVPPEPALLPAPIPAFRRR